MVITLLVDDVGITTVLIDGAPVQNVAAAVALVGEAVSGISVSQNITVAGAQALLDQLGRAQRHVFDGAIAATVLATATRLEQLNEQPNTEVAAEVEVEVDTDAEVVDSTDPRRTSFFAADDGRCWYCGKSEVAHNDGGFCPD